MLDVRASGSDAWDLVALGEVMLRLDPGEGRIHTARQFHAWEGGGEYNVARGLRRCFGLRTAIVTSLVDNPIGRLIEDLIQQGGVDHRYLVWLPDDGVGRAARNGLNFTERGFGLRAAIGCSDRGNTAVSQLRDGDIDWAQVFDRDGARWFHVGGVFTALSPSAPAVAREAMVAARRHGAVVSYDLNYRHSLWRTAGGSAAAQRVNRELVGLADVLFGNEEDFAASLGFRVPKTELGGHELDRRGYADLLQEVARTYPNLRLIAATLRVATTATRNDWGAICWGDGRIYTAHEWGDLEILDRVGAGDAFASGMIYGLLEGKGTSEALEYGVAHGALAMTTPGDTSMATMADVERVIAGRGARIDR